MTYEEAETKQKAENLLHYNEFKQFLFKKKEELLFYPKQIKLQLINHMENIINKDILLLADKRKLILDWKKEIEGEK